MWKEWMTIRCFGERGRDCVVFIFYFFFFVVNDAVKMSDLFFIELGVKKWKGQLFACELFVCVILFLKLCLYFQTSKRWYECYDWRWTRFARCGWGLMCVVLWNLEWGDDNVVWGLGVGWLGMGSCRRIDGLIVKRRYLYDNSISGTIPSQVCNLNSLSNCRLDIESGLITNSCNGCVNG